MKNSDTLINLIVRCAIPVQTGHVRSWCTILMYNLDEQKNSFFVDPPRGYDFFVTDTKCRDDYVKIVFQKSVIDRWT